MKITAFSSHGTIDFDSETAEPKIAKSRTFLREIVFFADENSNAPCVVKLVFRRETIRKILQIQESMKVNGVESARIPFYCNLYSDPGDKRPNNAWKHEGDSLVIFSNYCYFYTENIYNGRDIITSNEVSNDELLGTDDPL